MARGRAKVWATAEVTESFQLGKAGIKVVLWGKKKRKRTGTAIISVGGIRWKGFHMKNAVRISWAKLQELAEG